MSSASSAAKGSTATTLPRYVGRTMPASTAAPTARQREYLVFIKAFTDRWSVPPSFEEIGRHFQTTPPSVNSMIKTLEARGFLARVPGAARTLRVLVPDDELRDVPPTKQRKSNVDTTVQVRMASLVMERLVPALRGVVGEHFVRAVNAVAEALDVELRAAGVSEDQRQAAGDALIRVARIAQGVSPETRPGRRLPWWRPPR